MRSLALCSLLFLAVAGPTRAADDDETVVRGRLGRELDEAVAKAGGSDLWGAVLVAKDGEILLAKGYGFADYKETPNTARTLFELASASKQVAATAILHLQQRGKLKVTDTLDRFFDGLPKDKKKVQVHHLLTHTSGLSDKLGVPYASPIPRKEYVKKMLAPPLVAEPGSRYAYSNVGYALLAAIVEKASKKSFEEYVEKWLFGPTDMEDSGFIGDEDLGRSGRDSQRRQRQPGQSGAAQAVAAGTAAKWNWGWGYRGMGGVVTTVHDLLRWDRALRSNALLEEESLEALHTPFKGGYAYGWRVETTDRGTRKAHHSGGVLGYGTNVVRYLEEDVAIFVLSNNGQAAFAVTGAVEKLLFVPTPIQAEIDVKPYDLARTRILKLPEKVTWSAAKKKRTLLLRLRDRRHDVVSIRVPMTYAAKLIDSLQQAIAAREGDDDGGKAKTEAVLYLQRYDPGSSRCDLKEGLSLDILPEYRGKDPQGKPVIDRRAVLILKDARYGLWPLMAKMNVAAAREFLALLQKAAKRR